MNNIAALIQAVAFVHPDGAPDAELISMLAYFLGVVPASEVPTERQNKAGDHDTGPATMMALPVSLSNRDSLRSNRSERDRHPSTPSIAASGNGLLQAQPSTVQKIAERADLAPNHSSANTSQDGRTRSVDDIDASSVPIESLFASNRVRSILRGLATIPISGGEPNIASIVDMLAQGSPASRLPNCTLNTLAHAVELLFDVGPAMLPFSRDKQQLASMAVRLIGTDRIRIADFIDDPLQGIRMQRKTRWQPFAWPDRRSIIIVVSDVGIGSGISHHSLAPAWHVFLRQAAHREIRTVALIPYSSSRWPSEVAAFDAALPWDLVTGVQTLRRATRRHRYMK